MGQIFQFHNPKILAMIRITKPHIFKRQRTLSLFSIFYLCLFFMLVQTTAQAQENNKVPMDIRTSKLRQNTDYYLAVYFDYNPGKAGEAFKMIEKYFIPVDKAAKRFVIQFRPMTGPWDEIAFFPLKIGPKALSFSISPSDARWNSTFVKQVGSQEQVDEIWKKFQSLLVKTKSELVMRPLVYK